MTCKARQQSDQMYCPLCVLTWDMNDPDPPLCPEDKNKRHKSKFGLGRSNTTVNNIEGDR